MKKIIAFSLTMILVISLMMTSAFASVKSLGDVTEDVERANARIEALIDQAIEKTYRLIDRYEIFVAKSKYDDTLIKKLNERIQEIIDDLVESTNRVAAETKEKAAKEGYKVICEMVEVNIGGRLVLIDPMRIGGF